MKLLLAGSRAGLLVGAPQICKSKPGSRPGSASGASAAVTVLKNVAPKLTGSPSKVSTDCARVNSRTASRLVAGGVAEVTLESGAGKVLPLMRVYGIRP